MNEQQAIDSIVKSLRIIASTSERIAKSLERSERKADPFGNVPIHGESMTVVGEVDDGGVIKNG